MCVPTASHSPPPQAHPRQTATQKSCARNESTAESDRPHCPVALRPEDVDLAKASRFSGRHPITVANAELPPKESAYREQKAFVRRKAQEAGEANSAAV